MPPRLIALEPLSRNDVLVLGAIRLAMKEVPLPRTTSMVTVYAARRYFDRLADSLFANAQARHAAFRRSIHKLEARERIRLPRRNRILVERPHA